MRIYNHHAYPGNFFISGLKSPEMDQWQLLLDASNLNATVELCSFIDKCYTLIHDHDIDDYWAVNSDYDVKRFITMTGRKRDYPTTIKPK